MKTNKTKFTKRFIMCLMIVLAFSLTVSTHLFGNSSNIVVYADTQTHNGITFSEWETTYSLPTESGSYYLTKDLTLSSSCDIDGIVVNLCLNGHGIVLGENACIYVKNGATLNLYDCDTSVTHYITTDNDGIFVSVSDTASEGAIEVVGGYIAGSTISAIYTFTETATFNMYGGTICCNKTGVYVNGSQNAFTMNGGSISYNQVGVQVDAGIFTMEDGTISHNFLKASHLSNGAGVRVNDRFVMNGGSIEYNTAEDSQTYGNTGEGGGIFAYINKANGYIELNGGKISHNTAKYGGGVFIDSSTYIDNVTTTINNVEISYNIATSEGGGIYTSRGSLIINGGLISNNQSEYGGGGVYNSASFTMTGGEISNNTLKYFLYGDGAGLFTNHNITMSGNPVIKNNSYTYTDFDYNTETYIQKYAPNNLFVYSGRTINFDNPLTTGADIGITMESAPGVFTNGLDGKLPEGKNVDDIFSSDDSKYIVTLDGTEGALTINAIEMTYDSTAENDLVIWKFQEGYWQFAADVTDRRYEYNMVNFDCVIDKNCADPSGEYSASVLTTATIVNDTDNTFERIIDGTCTITVVSDKVVTFQGLLLANNNKYYKITITYTSTTPVLTVLTPTFTPESGTYEYTQNITISTATEGATIYYTTDGSTPTTNSMVYSELTPIVLPEVNGTYTIKAMAVKENMNNSKVGTATYTLTGYHTHAFTFVAEGNKITAVCGNDGCPITEGLTLTLNAPTDLKYSETAKQATLKAGYNNEVFANPQIKYYQGTTEVNECVNAGTYTAKVTFGDATAEVTFTITNWTIIDEEKGVNVEIEGAKEDESIAVEVEVKTDISNEEAEKDYTEEVAKLLEKNEEIAVVYEVKLVRTTIVGGVETKTEIQPSDIKEGTTIIIKMNLPTELQGKEFKLLHIHSADDMEFVTDYELSNDNTVLTLKVNKLSDFAFIVKGNAKGNGGVVALIVIVSLLVVLGGAYILLFFAINKWIIVDGKVVRAFKLVKKDDENKLVTFKCKFENRVDEQVFKTKHDAEKALKQTTENVVEETTQDQDNTQAEETAENPDNAKDE